MIQSVRLGRVAPPRDPMIADPLFYAAAIPAVILYGLSKGGFASGVGLLATPLLALAVPPFQAAAIMLPILMVMDATGLWAYRRTWDGASLKVLLPAALFGILIGWLTAAWMTDAAIRLMLGLVAVGFALDWWLLRRTADTAPRTPSRAFGWTMGALSGFTSFVAHAGGVPFQVYVLPKRLAPQVFAGTAIVFFSVVNAVKVAPYLALGLFSAENLATSAVLFPLAIASVAAGVWLTRRLSARLFYAIAYATMLIVGAELIRAGAVGLLRGS